MVNNGEQDYQKWMHHLKTIKNTGGKEGVSKMDKTISAMIIEYCKKLVSQGIDIANVGQNVVKVNDDESNSEKEYIDLDTVRIVMVWNNLHE